MKSFILVLLFASSILFIFVAADFNNVSMDRKACTKVYKPVCADDRKVYANACIAENNGKVHFRIFFDSKLVVTQTCNAIIIISES